MTKNLEDDKLVRKGAVKKVVKVIRKAGRWDLLEETIDKLPAVLPNGRQAVKIKSPEEIEGAIFDVIDRQKRMNINGFGYIERHSLIINIKRLLRKEIFGKVSEQGQNKG